MSHGLNPAQREAVETLSGPLLVLAGAGTGKTRVVTFRIAELIRHRTRPERILAVTFTNKAATEMQQRAGELLGKRLPTKPEISTFHSLCVRILRRHATRVGYPAQFAICDRGDQEAVARQVLREIRVPDAVLRPGDLVNQISRWKSASILPAQAATLAQNDKEHLASMGYRRYQDALKASGRLDFDDLLLVTEQLFHEAADARRAEAARFDHLLIDEYQDTNEAQYRIVRALAAPHRNLCVVGDDDQAIYGWRGAEVEHILRFHHDWPDAKVVRLEENYRSTEPILTLANRLIAFNRQRHPKTLRAQRAGDEPRVAQYPDETQEASEIVGEIRELVNTRRARPGDIAILFRTNEQPRLFEAELRRAKLPYTLVGGMSFYDRREVKDVLAYLKVCVRPDDEAALLRILNVPARGIGKAAVETLLARAVAEGKSLWQVLGEAAAIRELPAATREAVARFRMLIEQFAARFAQPPLADTLRSLIETIDYRAEIARSFPEPADQQARWSSIEEVVNALSAFEARGRQPSVLGFLDEVLLAGRDDANDGEEAAQRNAVVLMTLHSAKGLEFPRVYLVGLEEGLLPHHRSVAADGKAIDEERRLCYVGVTRARDVLTISMALARRKWGKLRPTIPSRFLFELLGKADSPMALKARRAATGGDRPKLVGRAGKSGPGGQRAASSPPAPRGKTASPRRRDGPGPSRRMP